MSKIIMKKALILGFIAINFAAQAEQKKEFLASRCSEIAQNVISLVSSQFSSTCVDKLHIASIQMKTAAALILEDAINAAKPKVDNAIAALQFAELSGCKRFIQISHSKLEANEVKHML
ncbi:MAG: hypothetical protein QM652_09920 [Legionella sp.]|uniref:hypothetical protein n=1 Tax=Legionella sp. TaxID=459 RepID=UPI0039E3893E